MIVYEYRIEVRFEPKAYPHGPWFGAYTPRDPKMLRGSVRTTSLRSLRFELRGAISMFEKEPFSLFLVMLTDPHHDAHSKARLAAMDTRHAMRMEEATLAQSAKKLIDSGMSKSDAADLLEISTVRLSKLLKRVT